MVNSGELFNAFSSYFKILENVGQYPQQDTNRLILLSFIQKMKADGYYATLSEKDKKTVDGLVECLKKKLCITLYAITCIKKQAEKIFIGDYEGCIFNNAAVPEYVDMNPVWQTESTACEVNSSGYNTGIKTEYQTNINPNYHGAQTKTTRSIDLQHCPNNTPSWTEVGRECEVSEGYNTGYQIVTYRDTNINSATYSTTRTEKVLNTDACPLPDTNPHWVETSRACNTVQYQHSSNPLASHTTGYATVVEQDINPASSTYQDTRTDENVPDENCPLEQVGYLTFDDSTVTKSATTDYQSGSYTLPLKYYLNDVLQNSLDVSVSAPAGITYSIDAVNKTVTINVAKNTTGADRTLVTTITGNHGNAVTFNVFQTGNSIFTFDNNLTTKTINNVLAAGDSWTETITSLAGDTPIGFSKSLIYSGMTATVNSNSTVSIAVSQNPSTSPRDLHLELKQQGSNKIIHLTAKQLGSPTPSDNYVFTANPVTISNILAAGETKNVAVASTKNGNAQAYSVDNASSTAISSGMAAVTITAAGISIVVSANSSASVRTGKVVLKQDTSNNTVEIDLSQNADTYVFTWQGGSDSDQNLGTNINPVSDQGTQQSYLVVSTKNGASHPFIVSSASTATSFAEANIGTNIAEVEVYENKNKNGKSGYFLLRQTDSGNELKINITQEGNQVSYDSIQINKGLGTQSVNIGSFIDNDPDSEHFASISMDSEETVYLDIPRDGYISFSKNVTANGEDCNSNTKYPISDICPNSEQYINITFR